jgi:apolipoprotein N-acyltransferase
MNLLARIGLVVLSAALMVLSFPPFGAWPLIVVALLPLLLAIRGATARERFYLGMLHGILAYAGALHWLVVIFGPAAFPLFCILALFTGLFCLLAGTGMARSWSPFVTVPLTAALWTGLEFYRSELFLLRFPWITVGSALGPTWLSPLVGVYGVTFLIVLAATGLFHRRTWWPAATLALLVLAAGAFRPPPVDLAADEGITVAVVQAEEGYHEDLIDLTRSVADQHPQLVVWPEYALPYDVRNDREEVFEELKGLCAELNATLVLGTKTTVGPGPKDWRNTALTMDANGTVGEYYKARPVHFFNDGIAGTEFNPVPTPLGQLATPVCFDCDNATVSRALTANGAEWFAVPIFDAQSWGEVQHRQHAQLARLRAAENARWFACAASSGVSQVIDPHGNVHAILPTMKSGVLVAQLGRNSGLTVFTRAGWLLPWVALAVTVGFAVWSAIGQLGGTKRSHTGDDATL